MQSHSGSDSVVLGIVSLSGLRPHLYPSGDNSGIVSLWNLRPHLYPSGDNSGIVSLWNLRPHLYPSGDNSGIVSLWNLRPHLYPSRDNSGIVSLWNLRPHLYPSGDSSALKKSNKHLTTPLLGTFVAEAGALAIDAVWIVWCCSLSSTRWATLSTKSHQRHCSSHSSLLKSCGHCVSVAGFLVLVSIRGNYQLLLFFLLFFHPLQERHYSFSSVFHILH